MSRLQYIKCRSEQWNVAIVKPKSTTFIRSTSMLCVLSNSLVLFIDKSQWQQTAVLSVQHCTYTSCVPFIVAPDLAVKVHGMLRPNAEIGAVTCRIAELASTRTRPVNRAVWRVPSAISVPPLPHPHRRSAGRERMLARDRRRVRNVRRVITVRLAAWRRPQPAPTATTHQALVSDLVPCKN